MFIPNIVFFTATYFQNKMISFITIVLITLKFQSHEAGLGCKSRQSGGDRAVASSDAEDICYAPANDRQ
jgi:hypothetical protein